MTSIGGWEAKGLMGAEIAGVLGLCPGLVVEWPGEPAGVKRRGVRAVVIGAGWWRLRRAGESGREHVVVLMVLWWLGAGSLTAFRSGMWLQSSIRSREADQSVVRGSGAQSSGRPS